MSSNGTSNQPSVLLVWLLRGSAFFGLIGIGLVPVLLSSWLVILAIVLILQFAVGLTFYSTKRKFRLWWTFFWIGLSILIFLVMMGLLHTSYWAALTSATPGSSTFQPLSTAYGWSMLILSFILNLLQGAIVLLVIWFSQKKVLGRQIELQAEIARSQTSFQNSLEEDRIKREHKEIISDFQRDLSVLCLVHNLRTSQSGEEVQKQAHLLTQITMDRLNGENRRLIIRMILNEELITGSQPIISLGDVTLSDIDFRKLRDLSNINLSGSDLSRSNFEGTILIGAILTNTKLTDILLKDTNIDGADFTFSTLKREQVKDVRSDNGTTYPW